VLRAPADTKDEAAATRPNTVGVDNEPQRQMDGVLALYRFTDRLYRAVGADDVYASALDAIAEALACKRASILLFDADGVMRFVAWRGLSDAYRQAVEGHAPWSRNASDPQPICIDDIEKADLPDDLRETIRTEGIGALAFFPLVAGGALAGKFMTYYDRPYQPAQSEIDLAQTIARQLSFSIERMRAEESRVRAEENLRQGEERERARSAELQADIAARQAAEHRLNVLNDIARMLLSELDLERLVQKITDCATDLCGAQFGAFFYNVTNDRGESYLLYSLSGASRETFRNFAIPRNTPLIEPTFRGRGVVRSGDVRKDPRYGRNPPHRGMPKGHLPVVSYLAVPVISRSGEVHGGLLFGHSQPDVFTKEGEDIVVGIAAHAAIAIDNARLFQAAARLGAIVETSDDAIVSIDLAGVVTSWNGGAERLYGYTAEEVVGRPVAILMPPAARDEELHIVRRIKRGERVNPYETVRRRKDGSLVEVSLNVSPLKDASGNIVGASKIARDITALKQAQSRQELLTHEVQHRTKNLFAVVHAVVARSFAGRVTIDEAKAAVLSRLESLAQTHAMLMDKEWHGADLAEIVRAEMSPFTGRVAIDGPSLELSAKAAQNFAMALHELATNAAKYGALSNTAGQIHVRWQLSTNDTPAFSFSWLERGGPAVTPPERKGFGTAVLEQIMAEYIGQRPEMRFEKEGLTYALQCPLAAISA
jgi:PAS domain S-box-containing protein